MLHTWFASIDANRFAMPKWRVFFSHAIITVICVQISTSLVQKCGTNICTRRGTLESFELFMFTIKNAKNLFYFGDCRSHFGNECDTSDRKIIIKGVVFELSVRGRAPANRDTSIKWIEFLFTFQIFALLLIFLRSFFSVFFKALFWVNEKKRNNQSKQILCHRLE